MSISIPKTPRIASALSFLRDSAKCIFEKKSEVRIFDVREGALQSIVAPRRYQSLAYDIPGVGPICSEGRTSARKERGDFICSHQAQITAVDFSMDGKRILIGYGDETGLVEIRDVAAKKTLYKSRLIFLPGTRWNTSELYIEGPHQRAGCAYRGERSASRVSTLLYGVPRRTTRPTGGKPHLARRTDCHGSSLSLHGS